MHFTLSNLLISNNFYAHAEQGDNPGQEKESSDGVAYMYFN